MNVCKQCGSSITRQTKAPKDGLCRICFNIWRAETYFEQLERNRRRHEKLNKRSYEQARDLSAWLSIYRYGAEQYKERAKHYINTIVEIGFPPYN